MKIKTSVLIGPALDWAVAMCEGKADDCEVHAGNVWYGRVTSGFVQYRPSTKWEQSGPIIQREKIGTEEDDGIWSAYHPAIRPKSNWWSRAETPLIAAMRCYVAFKLGDEIEIPEELTK